ncbi:CLUMA_CG008408, isoform A, partial [Clunio marinus]
KQFALENLGESEDIAKSSVLEIQKFLKDFPEINAHNDERFILFFLRSCKFDVEQTKNRIRNFYKQRAERDEWFVQRDPFLPEISELLSIGVFLPLREKDAENRQIVIIRTAAHSPSNHKQNDVFKVGRMILDYLVSIDESISVYGIRAIFDMQGIAFGHALQMTPMLIKRAVNSWDSYPLRIQKLEFINANLGINVVLDIFRSFMSAKMKERVSVTRGKPNYKASDNLPKELGGNVDSYSILASHWKQLLEKNYQWFQEDEKYKSLI